MLRLERPALARRLLLFLGLGPNANVRELSLLSGCEVERERVVVAHEVHVVRSAVEVRVALARHRVRQSPRRSRSQIRDEDVAIPFDGAHGLVARQIAHRRERPRAVHLRDRQRLGGRTRLRSYAIGMQRLAPVSARRIPREVDPSVVRRPPNIGRRAPHEIVAAHDPLDREVEASARRCGCWRRDRLLRAERGNAAEAGGGE